MIDVRSFTGDGAAPYFDDVARLRIAVFRDFPYLYDGDAGYEREYLATYATAEDSVFVLAFDGDRVIGASTGLPLACEPEQVRAPWQAAGIDPASVFYFGESVLLPAYRGQGLGHRFFDAREQHAAALGRFERTSFCAVERAPDDPRRPVDHRPLDAFWTARGYVRHDELACVMHWKEVGAEAETPHRLVFWSRPLAAGAGA
jgi:GNAT superfamily N-acetyltransferase